MFKAILFICLAAVASGQYPGLDYNNIPNPYQFSYSSPSEGGQSSHQESGDGSGRVTGSYTVQDEDGRSRLVEYVADENGFRASITTNEPGTSNQSPADVTINSSADDGQGGGIQYGAAQGLQYGAAPGLQYGAVEGLQY